MTTWYVDYENGTDAAGSTGNGDSFATRRKWVKNLGTNMASGDTVRIMASPSPTSLGSCTWFKDTDAESSTILNPMMMLNTATNATPIRASVYDYQEISNGDYVVIILATGNTNANGFFKVSNKSTSGGEHFFDLLFVDGTNSSGNGTYDAYTGTLKKITGCCIELPSALTKNIFGYKNGLGTVWTAATGDITIANTATPIKTDNAVNITVAANFTTGKAAYYTLPSTFDLSAYKQLSIIINQNSGTSYSDNDISIKFCSDTTGDTPVDTFDLPMLRPNTVPKCYVVDKGSALGSSIQSIAVYVNNDRGATTLRINQILACKDSTSADSLTHRSLIGKNNGEPFYPICWIEDKVAVIGSSYAIVYYSTTSRAIGYIGTSETVTSYKLDPTFLPALPATTGSEQDVWIMGMVGTDNISVSGGWDRTAMTTQNSQTVIDGRFGLGDIYSDTNYSGFTYKMSWSNLSAVRCTNLIDNSQIQTQDWTITLDWLFCGILSSLNYRVANFTISANFAGGTQSIPITSTATIGTLWNGLLRAYYGSKVTFTKLYATFSNTSNVATIQLYEGSEVIGGTVYQGANLAEFFRSDKAILRNCTWVCQSQFGGFNVVYFSSGLGKARIKDLTLARTTLFLYSLNTLDYNQGFDVDGGLYLDGYNGDPSNRQIYHKSGSTITTNTSIRHTPQGVSWKFSPTSATRIRQAYPLRMKIAEIPVTVGKLATFNLWAYRTNTGINGRLVCYKRSLLGIAADVADTISVAADTWEQLSISVGGHIVSGVLEVYFEVWGGTTYSVYIDDFSWSS